MLYGCQKENCESLCMTCTVKPSSFSLDIHCQLYPKLRQLTSVSGAHVFMTNKYRDLTNFLGCILYTNHHCCAECPMLSRSQPSKRVAQQRENGGQLGEFPSIPGDTPLKRRCSGVWFPFLFLPNLLCHNSIREGRAGV